MDPIFGAVQQNLDSALSVPFVSSSVLLGLAFYAYKAAPELPSFMEELFLNVFFQIFVGFMVLYMSTQNFMLSLVVSVVFVYGMKMLSNVKEGMTSREENLERMTQLDNGIKNAVASGDKFKEIRLRNEKEALKNQMKIEAIEEEEEKEVAQAEAEGDEERLKMLKRMRSKKMYRQRQHHGKYGMMGGEWCNGVVC